MKADMFHIRGLLRRKTLFAIIVAFALQSAVLSVQAQTQSQEVFRGTDGGYEVIVNVQPVKPVVGTVHFSVLPLNAETGGPVQRALVTIFVNNEPGGELFKAPALSSPRFPNFYESNFKFETEGTWDVRVQLHSDELGDASVSFPLEIGGQAFTPTNVGGTIFFFVMVAVLIGGVLYVWYSTKRIARSRANQT